MKVTEVKNYMAGILKDVDDLEGNLDKGHEKLAKIHANYQKEAKSSDLTKKAAKATDVLWQEDYNKYDTAKSYIAAVKNEINRIDKYIDKLKTAKDPTGYTESITTSLKYIDTALFIIGENSAYLHTRQKENRYYLGEQDTLKEKGLSFSPAMVSLSERIKSKIEVEGKKVFNANDRIRVKKANAPHRPSSPNISKITGSEISKTAAIQEQRDIDRESLEKALAPGTSLKDLGKEDISRIMKHAGARHKAKQAAIEAGDEYKETNIEKLLFDRTGLNTSQILEEGALAKKIASSPSNVITPSPAEVANITPEAAAPSPSDIKLKKQKTTKKPKVIAPSPAEVANITPEVATPASRGGGSIGGGGGSSNPGGAKGIVDVRLVDITTSAIKQLDDLLVKVLGSSPIGNGGGGGGTGDMATLAQELKLSRESNEKIAKMYEARRKKSVEEFKKKNEEKKAKKEKLDDPNSEESIAKAIRAKKRKERDSETIRKADPNSLESLAEKAREEQRLQSNLEAVRKSAPDSPESLANKIREEQRLQSNLETIRKADPNSPESLANKIREEQRLQSNLETIRKSAPDSPESIAKSIKATQAAQSAAETIRKSDPNSPESLAKKIREEKRLQRDLETIRNADPNSPENLAKAAAAEEKRKKKEEKDEKKKLNVARQADPFRKRLQTIFKEGEQELSFLYAKVDSFAGWIPGFNSAILDARKKGLETLTAGYEAFDEAYAKEGGGAFKGMMASLNAMFKVSPIVLIMAGLTTAFIGILGAATRLNSKIKEISAELGTSNMQSYEFFKNAMNAQTQYDNMYASLRDVRDVQKGILGDSGILLQVNDKALASIADNAKNIGVSTEGAGAFTEALRTKGATDVEAANLMAASLELADKSKFIMPQSVMDDIAQNVEFSSKYFSNINKDSKSAQKHLVDTNLQVKALGLNFQKAAKMTQHLLSFEQSIVGEVEASVALGRHVNIGKARELLLQDDIGGAMQQMMDTMGGYDEFQNMDFAKRQLMANAVGLEVSELEKSLYLRDKIGITNEEALNAAMKNSDYLDKVAGKNVELYKVEAKKVLAAEQFNTAVEKVSMAFKSSLLPVLEAILPIVELMASAINFVAGGIKTVVGGITGANKNKEAGAEAQSSTSMMQMGSSALMATVMGGQLLKMIKGPAGGKIGEVVGKARGGFDTLTGSLGTKTNPMYVISLGGGGMVEGLGGSAGGGKFVNGKFRSQAVLDRAESIRNIRNAKNPAPKPGFLKGILNNAKGLNFGSIVKNTLKTGGVASAVLGVLDYADRKGQGQSTAQAASGAISGSLGSLGGAALGAAIGTMLLPGIGTIIGGMLGGYAGHTAGSSMSDSFFNKKPSSSYETQPFQYQGMGLSATGSIYGGVNKQKPIGTPVETSMVDTTPTTLKPNFSSPFGTTPNYGTTSMSRESVMVNKSSKSVATSATMQKTIKEKEKTDETLLKATDYTNKLLEALVSKQNSPVVAYFNDEGRRQVKSTLRKESSP